MNEGRITSTIDMEPIKITDYSVIKGFVGSHFPVEYIPIQESEQADYILGIHLHM